MDGAPVICFQKIQFRPCKLCEPESSSHDLSLEVVGTVGTQFLDAPVRGDPRSSLLSNSSTSRLDASVVFDILHILQDAHQTQRVFHVFSCFPRFSMSFSDLKAFGCVFLFKRQKSQLAKVREAILQRRAWHPENGHLWPTLARRCGFVEEADAPERSKHIFLVFRYVQL